MSKQADHADLKKAVKSHAQPTIIDMLSRGSRCLRAREIIHFGGDDVKYPRMVGPGHFDRIRKDHLNMLVGRGMIFSALSQNTWIRAVDLTGVSLGSGDDDEPFEHEIEAQDLVEAAVSNGIGRNSMGPSVASTAPIMQLATILRSNTSITELSVDGFDFSSADLHEFMAALKCNASIKSLHLLDFKFHERESGCAGPALVDLLRQFDDNAGLHRRHASAIEALEVTAVAYSSGTDNFRSKELCTALKCNATLTSVDLGDCFLSNGLANLVDALEHNPRIVRFKINPEILKQSARNAKLALAVDRILKPRFLASRPVADASNAV
jgi:hypothetical protein